MDTILSDVPVIDTHIHIRGYHDLRKTMAICADITEKCNLEAWSVLALTAWDPDSVAQNVLCITEKALYKEAYAFAGIDHFLTDIDKSAEGRLAQLKEFWEMGFDGIKLIETKPSSRKVMEAGLQDASYDLFFNYLEETKIPIVWHVADPEENWDEEACCDYAKEHGWFYGDGTFLSKEETYQEAIQVLDKHPDLCVTFAHLFFLSKDLERAKAMLDKYPNIYFDVTPGLEMYYNFDEAYDEWRQFFIDYKDRIILGTDNGWGDEPTPEEKVESGCFNISMLRAYFGGDQPVKAWNGSYLKGMNLPKDVLHAIFHENYRKTLKSQESRPVNFAKAIQYAETMAEQIKDRTDICEDAKIQLTGLIELLKETSK